MDKTDKILCVGLVCLDIVNYCDHYPSEDEDVRASNQKWHKGGNAANTASVLRMFGREVEFFGTIGSGMETDYAISQLDHYGIEHGNCVIHQGYRSPVSCVVLNTTTGARTIVHYRDLPELTAKDFARLDLNFYSWIHFEGKNPDELIQMVAAIRKHNLTADQPITISIELEKKKEFLIPLETLPDVLFISKEYAGFRGYHSAQEACMQSPHKQDAIVICAWGETGATAMDSNGQVFSSPSFPPPGGLVDTLGAGDTFNAAVIHSLSRGGSLEDVIVFGCRIAGRKCGMEGFEGLKDFKLV